MTDAETVTEPQSIYGAAMNAIEDAKLYYRAACQFDQFPLSTSFAQFSEANPWAKKYHETMQVVNELLWLHRHLP